MSLDLTCGMDPEDEYVFAERPDDPEMRDSVSFWVFDDCGEVGLPRVGIEAVASNWDTRAPGERRLSRRSSVPSTARREGMAGRGPGRSTDGARRRAAQLPVRRAIPDLGDDLCQLEARAALTTTSPLSGAIARGPGILWPPVVGDRR
jgi:hypothetical protein